VDLAKRGRETNGDTQKLGHRHRSSQESLEWLAARVLEHEHGPPLMLGKRERSHSPGGIEIGP
jgi:hypothetical protein